MRAVATTAFLALAGIAVATQAPQIQNAGNGTPVASQAVTSLSRDVAALAATTAGSDASAWIAWQVPMIDGERNLCCTYLSPDAPDGIRGCRVEPPPAEADRTVPTFPPTSGPVQLEAGTKLTMFVRLINGRVERLRALSDDCPVDAGGRPVTWLTGVTGDDSVAWLRTVATDESMDFDVRKSIGTAAVRALALHRAASAVPTLIELAGAAADTPMALATRREAMEGLGQSRDPRALQFLQDIITR